MAFSVTAKTDVRESGTVFGPFEKRDQAEDCVIALATRVDIKSATISEDE